MRPYLLIALLLAATGCKTFESVVWPTTVKCLGTPAMQLFNQVKEIVMLDGFSPVFTDRSVELLEDLAREHGPQTIACILAELIEKFTPREAIARGTVLPEQDVRQSQRIATFLKDRNVKVETEDAGTNADP